MPFCAWQRLQVFEPGFQNLLQPVKLVYKGLGRIRDVQKQNSGVPLITHMEDHQLTEGIALPGLCFNGLEEYKHQPTPASVLALQAIISGSLLEDELLTEDSSVELRWYDARARAAAVRMSIWCVP